jgi:hypothetical protein
LIFGIKVLFPLDPILDLWLPTLDSASDAKGIALKNGSDIVVSMCTDLPSSFPRVHNSKVQSMGKGVPSSHHS